MEEVGYVLLEECDVSIPSNHLRSAAVDSSVWHDINISCNDHGEITTDDTVCDLVLQPSNSESGDKIVWSNTNQITPFNGVLSEIVIDKFNRRSDASLLLGLAVEINNQAAQTASELAGDNDNLHFRQIHAEKMQIMFWGVAPAVDMNAQIDNEVEDDKNYPLQQTIRVKASLLITFSLPTCRTNSNTLLGEGQTTKKSKTKTKMLSTGQQLLGSIIRCDWSYLDATIQKIDEKAHTTGGISSREVQQNDKSASSKSFFPDSLNVEELYDRISNAGKYLGIDEKGDTRASNNISYKLDTSADSSKTFLDLPNDIIARDIATYLHAPSLHALRVVNRKMYKTLRAVVPGLRLKLFQHQILSLEWMELRERQCITEGDLCQHETTSVSSEALCGGDYHRAVTGGSAVKLNPRPRPTNNCVKKETEPLRFDSESGFRISSDNKVRSKTRCARGGLLCDDPGLGKTITVLSLLLRSFGLTTVKAVVDSDAGVDENSLFYQYWHSSFLTEHVRRPAILKLISRLIKSDKESGWFVSPMEEFLACDALHAYFDTISQPICLQDLRKKYDKSDCKDFKTFESEVRKCFSNAMKFNPIDDAVYRAAERLSKNFADILAEFKAEQLKVAVKSMSRMAKHGDSSLLDAFEARKKAELEKHLVPSSSTLLVVPPSLISHWEEQMLMHIDFNYISCKRATSSSPYIYYHTSKRSTKAAKVSNPKVTLDMKDIIDDPLIFIDDGSKELPHEDILARFPIVLTSYNRFTSDWKNGSVEQEMRASKGKSNCSLYWGEDDTGASALLKVRWLRVIVDEGHVLGKSTNNLIQFASWLTSERHWGMTGTPTQQVATQTGLKNLYYLTNFLRHDFFNRRLGRDKVWNRLINQGWNAGDLSSFFRLKHLVSYLMVRHTKADLIEIPPPIYSIARIELSTQESTTYNTIVSAIKTNLITTSMEGKTSGYQDSLLNPRQSRYASEALTNLRVACCGGTRILPHILNHHWVETLDMCRTVHSLDEVKVKVVNDFIYRSTTAELSGCNKCGCQLQTLFVIPCGHLVCVECMTSTTITCPCCEQPFDVDDFQRLQPGLNFQFNLSVNEEKEEREKQYALKHAFSLEERSAIDIDELEDVEGIDAPPVAAQARKHKKGENCIYSSRLCDGKCKICREEHFDCNFMNEEKQCSICFKHAEDCPTYASKSKYVVDKLLQLRQNDDSSNNIASCTVSPLAARLFSRPGSSINRPLKAVVFSQHRTTYEYFGDRLIRRFGGACVADYSYGGTRSQELQKFIHQPECFVMLLSKQGSVGLDLSFVTHIFFLDSIFDKSLEAQVVARAYRMGALGSVFVEQLTAKDSIEEVLNELNAGSRQATALADTKSTEKHAKLHYLLKSTKLIRPQHETKAKKRKACTGIDDGSTRQLVRTAGGVRFKD